jgi:hypothetical protein
LAQVEGSLAPFFYHKTWLENEGNAIVNQEYVNMNWKTNFKNSNLNPWVDPYATCCSSKSSTNLRYEAMWVEAREGRSWDQEIFSLCSLVKIQ